MNEQGCAFVCAIFSLLTFVLSAYVLTTGDMKVWWVVLAFGIVVNLLSGYVIICRFM